MNLNQFKQISSIHPHSQADAIFVNNTTRKTLEHVDSEKLYASPSGSTAVALGASNSPADGKLKLAEIIYDLERLIGTPMPIQRGVVDYRDPITPILFTEFNEITILDKDSDPKGFKAKDLGVILAWHYTGSDKNQIIFFLN